VGDGLTEDGDDETLCFCHVHIIPPRHVDVI
jgi:hypothetical protein